MSAATTLRPGLARPRPSGLVAATAAAQAGAGGEEAALREWLAIPSVSGDARGRPALDRAAAWLADRLRGVGAQVRCLPTADGPPVVAGHVAGPPGAPVVLVYGHYDVRPAGRGWTTPAFTPTRRGGLLYARGTADDKGQLLAHVAALAAWRRAGGPPADVWIVAEGAEEVGSPGFAAAVARLPVRVRPDVVVVSDTERAGVCTPAVVVSQRGAVALDLVVDVGGSPVHAGRLGGAVVDPSAVLGDVLGALRRGLPRWAAATTPPVVSRVRSDPEIIRSARGRAVTGSGLDERIAERSALAVTDLRAGDGSGAVPARCRARLDVRLPPGTDPAPVLARMRQVVRAGTPVGVRTEVRVRAAHRGLRLRPEPWVHRAVGEACRAGFGRPAVHVRSGGSIPAVAMLRTAFGVDPVLLGLGTPAGNAHGPDEHLDLAGWHRSVRTCIALLACLAAARGREERR